MAAAAAAAASLRDTGAQVTQLAWSPHAPELASALGFSQNALVVWRYPALTRVATLTGHSARVLYMAAAPDGQVLVTGAGDETLRFWSAFAPPLHAHAPRTDGLLPEDIILGRGGGWPTAAHRAAVAAAAAAAADDVGRERRERLVARDAIVARNVDVEQHKLFVEKRSATADARAAAALEVAAATAAVKAAEAAAAAEAEAQKQATSLPVNGGAMGPPRSAPAVMLPASMAWAPGMR